MKKPLRWPQNRSLSAGSVLTGRTRALIEDAIREITQALQKADGRIAYVYVRPSDRAHQSSR
jgi:hypothetical protein